MTATILVIAVLALWAWVAASALRAEFPDLVAGLTAGQTGVEYDDAADLDEQETR